MIRKCCAINSRTTQRFLNALPYSFHLPNDVGVQKLVNHLTEDLNLTLSNTLDVVAHLKTFVTRNVLPGIQKTQNPEARFQKIGTEMVLHQTGSLPTSLERQYRAVSKSHHCCSIILFLQTN